jgi:hypothetical protein
MIASRLSETEPMGHFLKVAAAPANTRMPTRRRKRRRTEKL